MVRLLYIGKGNQKIYCFRDNYICISISTIYPNGNSRYFGNCISYKYPDRVLQKIKG